MRVWRRASDEPPGGMAVLSWLREARRCYRRSAAARAVMRVLSFWLVGAAGCLGSAWALSRAGFLASAGRLANAQVSAAALGLAVPLCLLTWGAAYLLNRPSLLRMARRADASFALDDRLATAFECLHGRATLLSPMLVADAASRLGDMEPSRVAVRPTAFEVRFLPVAAALALAASALAVALPATPVRSEDAAVRKEGERLGSAVRRLQDSLSAQDDASRKARSFLARAEALARGMAGGALGAEEAARGLAGLLEELAPEGADPGAAPAQRLLGPSEPAPGGGAEGAAQTSVLDYDARAEELRSLAEGLSAASRREMSPDETSSLARRLREFARRAGSRTKAGEAAERAAEALESAAPGGERDEAIEDFLESAQESTAGSLPPADRDALEQLREAMERARRTLDERLQSMPPMPPIMMPGAGEGGTGPDRSPGGEIRRSGDAPAGSTGAGPRDETAQAGAPGTEPGSRTPGPSTPRLDSSGMLYPAAGQHGEGEIGVTTVLGRGATDAVGGSDADDGPVGPARVEESAVARDVIPPDYRIVVERYFD